MKQMNDFWRCATVAAAKNTVPLSSLTATALQLCISCHLLIYVARQPPQACPDVWQSKETSYALLLRHFALPIKTRL